MLVSNPKEINKYYKALVERDAAFVGIFYVGVKTTGIFCIATCRARKPKPENVEFYTSLKEPLLHGYRPCKICKPTENAQEMPEAVQTAIQLMQQSPMEKLGDYQLRQAGISPERVRRWFKKHYGMTFQAYQRMYRINNAYQELQKGKTATHSAYDAGYDSLSGFNYTYKKLLGNSPQQNKQTNRLLIHRFNTRLGPMFACASDQGLCLLEFVDRRMLETEFKDLQKRLNARILVGENEHIQQAKKELGEYFAGNRKAFSVPLHTPGTDFQNQVWQELLKIPFGNTRSYHDQAIHIGNPKAVRAVARANGCNRIAIIIPCHRVIGKDGSLTGYAGGLERKKWLLEHEAGIT